MTEIQILNNGDALYDIRRKINENFQLVQTKVEDVVTDPLSQFGVNEGNVTDGVADLLTLDGTTLKFKVGGEYPNLVMTSGDGVTTEIESVNDLHLQNLADGKYKILVNGESSQISGAEFYSQLIEPQNINNGDVWFNGESAKQYLTDAPSVTPITPKTTINYKCMGNIGDLYIAAGGGEYFYISRDGGTTWESRVLPANVSGFISCVVKDGYFYFATSTSSIMRTAEGEDPEVFHQFADTFYPQKIKVINDLFVLTASGPTLSTSSDGQTWNTITIDTEPIIDVFYIDDLYYIISRNGTIYTSQDLVTVTQKNKIEQSTYVQCAEIYSNTIIMGGISGSLYVYNMDTNKITLNNISSSEVILDMQVRPNGAMIFVGSNNMCKITYDFTTFQNLYTSGGYLEHIYKDFIMGQAGSFLRINQTVQWFDYPWVPIGELTISSGEVTYFTTYPYNSNGLHEASSSTFGLLRTVAATDELNCNCNDAALTPSNLYDLANYRLVNTQYNTDDTVGCPYHHNLQLRCITAGTTSEESLDTVNVVEEDVLQDGTVTWQVEQISTKNIINNKITNCILEAPNGVFVNDNGTWKVPKGLRFLVANGKNLDGTINNLDVTLQEDIIYDLHIAADDKHVIFLFSADKINWSIGCRVYEYQWFEQDIVPNFPDVTWFNTKEYIWRNKRTADGDGTWKAIWVIPIAIVNHTDGVLSNVHKTWKPIEIITDNSRLSDFQKCNLNKPTEIPYNTVFTAPCDGTITVYSLVSTTANYLSPASTIQILGKKGEFIESSATVTNNIEYTQAGTYTIEVSQDGYCDITLVGGGGNQFNGVNSMGYMSYASGGSGACFSGQVYLTAGTHTITVGGVTGASSIDNLVISGSGGNGSGGDYNLQPQGGTGGTLTINGNVQNVTTQSNGNSGGASNANVTQAGGASLYNGYGAGASSPSGSATGGYCYISYPTTIVANNGVDCYFHSIATGWDNSANTVQNSSIQSNELQAFKGEQFKFYTHLVSGNASIDLFRGVFYPCKREVN